MEEEYQKFHGLENAYLVRVVEGNGTEESVSREVLYVFDTDLVELGKIDNSHPLKSDVEIREDNPHH